MITITEELTIDVTRRNRLQALVAKQYDKQTRFIQVRLTNRDKSLTVDSGATVTINARRRDKATKSFAGTVNDDGTVTVPITYWMLELDGTVKCDISIFENNAMLTSTLFELKVEEAVSDGAEISGDENYGILLALISEANAARDAANSAAAGVSAAVDEALIQAKASGAFDGADGKSAYQSYLDNGGRLSEKDWLASFVHMIPEFANSIDECTDKSKLYVLPDGYIYAYIKTVPKVTYETHQNKQWDSSGTLKNASGLDAKNTNVIPVNSGDQFIYTGNGQYVASVYWLNSSVVTSSNILSIETYGRSGVPATVTLTAPSGARYAMFMSWEYANPGPVLEVTPLTGSYKWASTGHAFVPADYEDRIVALEDEVGELKSGIKDSVLAKKKIIYDGDSIAESRSNNGGGYAKLIAGLVGGFYVNQAVGGAYLRSTAVSGRHSVVDNLANLPKDGDLYCFEGGINDYWNNAALGSYSKSDYKGSVDATTVCGALETIFRYALNTFVGKPICFIITHKIQETAYNKNSNGDTFEDYRDAMIGICEKYSIPYYDAFSESGLNGWNAAQNNAFLTANATGEPDGCHPNEEGYKRYYVPQLLTIFEKIMPA